MRNVEREIALWKTRLRSPEGVWDEALLSKARRRDSDATHRLIHRFERRIAKIIDCRLGRAKVRDKEDLFQDVVVQLFDGIYHGACRSNSEAAFLRWLVLVVTQTLANWLMREADSRREKQYDTGLDSFESITVKPEDMLSAKGKLALVQDAMAQLEPREQKVLQYRLCQELSSRRTAKAMRTSVHAANALYRRAFTHLKEIVSEIPELIEEE